MIDVDKLTYLYSENKWDNLCREEITRVTDKSIMIRDLKISKDRLRSFGEHQVRDFKFMVPNKELDNKYNTVCDVRKVAAFLSSETAGAIYSKYPELFSHMLKVAGER